MRLLGKVPYNKSDLAYRFFRKGYGLLQYVLDNSAIVYDVYHIEGQILYEKLNDKQISELVDTLPYYGYIGGKE